MQAVESPSPPVRGAKLWPLSVAAYHALGEAGLIPENTELLYGFVYTKMPKSPLHSFLFQGMCEFIGRSLPPGKLLRVEQPITCESSEPEPDISVVSGSRVDFKNEHPRSADLVVEICVTSHEYDRSKLPAYATAGVKECWLVLSPERQIEVFGKPVNGQFTEHALHGPGGTLTSAGLPEFTISLDALFGK